MLKLLRSVAAPAYGSAALVFVTAAIVGHEAANGMNLRQWIGAIVAVLGAVSVAVMVHAWPEKAKAPANNRGRKS
jgi:hypothetical protein